MNKSGPVSFIVKLLDDRTVRRHQYHVRARRAQHFPEREVCPRRIGKTHRWCRASDITRSASNGIWFGGRHFSSDRCDERRLAVCLLESEARTHFHQNFASVCGFCYFWYFQPTLTMGRYPILVAILCHVLDTHIIPEVEAELYFWTKIQQQPTSPRH